MNTSHKILQTCFPKVITIILVLCLSVHANTQAIDSALLQRRWQANWIMASETNPTGYGVYYFRKSFELAALPKTFLVHVSADNRYKLFINEKLVSLGPARGDVLHWNYETVDLAPFLRMGHNVVAAQVWNEGELRADATISLRTGFILQGGSDEAQILNTNNTWKGIQDSGYSAIKVSLPTAYFAGPGEYLDMQKHVRGWEKLSYEDNHWKSAKTIAPGFPKNKIGYGGPNGWLLVPSILPQMELKQQRLVQLRKAEGVVVPASFPVTKTTITIPPNTKATLLLDQSFLTNAYPTLVFSGGKNSAITLGYAEALFTEYPQKNNRNEIEGKKLIGRKDSILSDGSEHQEFTALSWRTYRYLQINVTTKETPLLLEDIYGTFIGYPFQFNARLETDRNDLHKMLEIGWRTARLCAVDTYMDCPYYEQLQYIGDTRIQALISLYNSGDDRLLRNALNLIDYSRQPEGVTMSRYPSATPQYITTFSLWYIGMLHDYLKYGKDPVFVRNKLSGGRQILNYFQGFQQQDGSLRNLPWWNFTDWVKSWPLGVRMFGKDGNSAVLDLQLLWAYQLAADMEQRVGMKEYATIYQQKAEQLKKTIQRKYWDSTKNLFADRAEKDLFSQHTNSLAILTGMVSGSEATNIAKQLLTDATLSQASIYFKYYLHLALTKAGLGDDYLSWLGKWKENMDMGLTTWGETSDVEMIRSDCHAWGASPNIEFFRTILGIDSDAPGFTRVKIEPHLGAIKTIAGEMPHPSGKIKVNYNNSNGQMTADIELPSNTTGRFIWKGKSYVLRAGKNSIKPNGKM
jgi:alpha-L-rhamnosidase